MKIIEKLIENFYEKPKDFLEEKYCKLRKMIFWGWNMRNAHDFDAQEVYRVINLQLTRTYDVMKNHSHLQWNSDIDNPSMRKLRSAVEISRRLSLHDYYEDTICFNYLEEKYGEFVWAGFDHSCYKNVDPKDKSKVDAERLRLYKKAGQVRAEHKKYLFELLNKNLDSWWD